jgi:hypothetical protein
VELLDALELPAAARIAALALLPALAVALGAALPAEPLAVELLGATLPAAAMVLPVALVAVAPAVAGVETEGCVVAAVALPVLGAAAVEAADWLIAPAAPADNHGVAAPWLPLGLLSQAATASPSASRKRVGDLQWGREAFMVTPKGNAAAAWAARRLCVSSPKFSIGRGRSG